MTVTDCGTSRIGTGRRRRWSLCPPRSRRCCAALDLDFRKRGFTLCLRVRSSKRHAGKHRCRQWCQTELPGPKIISVSVVVMIRCGYLASGWVAGKCALQWLWQGGSALEREGDRNQHPRGDCLIALPCRHEAPAFHRFDRSLVEAGGAAARAQLDHLCRAVRRDEHPQDCAPCSPLRRESGG